MTRIKVYLNGGDARLVTKQNGLGYSLVWYGNMIGLIAHNFNYFD
jgi:hypothetical protein